MTEDLKTPMDSAVLSTVANNTMGTVLDKYLLLLPLIPPLVMMGKAETVVEDVHAIATDLVPLIPMIKSPTTWATMQPIVVQLVESGKMQDVLDRVNELMLILVQLMKDPNHTKDVVKFLFSMGQNSNEAEQSATEVVSK